VTDPARREKIRRIAAKVGVGVSAFCVFTAGWVAMKSDDWTTIVVVSILALVAGLVASRLSAGSR
jgi:hypothetical protein